MPDDIPHETTASRTERQPTPKDQPRPRKIGPESEVRGGSEAPDGSLDDGYPERR